MTELVNVSEWREPAMSYLYRGKHRLRSDHPSYVPFAISGTVGMAALVGLGTTGVAEAAPDSVWDRLAQCESSGNWSINTGNGYSGGLQFAPTTWDQFREGQFAESAFNATREQQIVVAERVLASQGWGAWPACSRKLGLRAYGVDLRTSGTPTTPPAPTEVTETTTRTPPPVTPSVSTPSPTPSRSVIGDTYVVVTGDTLSQIALDLHRDITWQELYNQNREVVEDPDLIYPGEILNIS